MLQRVLFFMKDRASPVSLLAGLLLVSFVLGALSLYVLSFFRPPILPAFTEVRANLSQYHFTNPLLFYKSDADARYDYLRDDVTKYVTKEKSAGNAQNISVYIRNMNTGEWTGINETEAYEPASMLKVTAMIAFFNRAAANPDILSKKILYKPTKNPEETYRASDDLAPGTYTVDDLITDMIVYSDNDALDALASADDGSTAEVFNLFELPLPATATTTDYMSARAYSRIFRVLYDSTYLSWDLSERALSLLSKTTFTQGIVAGVPAGTVVSHKFGERTFVSETGVVSVRELHDCGIVYKNNDPYFLCVMTRGSDFLKLQKIIADISRMTYNEIH